MLFTSRFWLDSLKVSPAARFFYYYEVTVAQIIEQVEALVEPILADLGFELVVIRKNP